MISDLDGTPARARRGGQFLGLREAEAEGLFDEDVFAGGKRGCHKGPMSARRQHEHRLDIVVREQFVVVAGRPLDVVARGDHVERRAIDVGEAGDGEEVRPLGQRRQVHHLRDATAADDADAQGPRHDSRVLRWITGG